MLSRFAVGLCGFLIICSFLSMFNSMNSEVEKMSIKDSLAEICDVFYNIRNYPYAEQKIYMKNILPSADCVLIVKKGYIKLIAGEMEFASAIPDNIILKGDQDENSDDYFVDMLRFGYGDILILKTMAGENGNTLVVQLEKI
jgi:hypothetical protein